MSAVSAPLDTGEQVYSLVYTSAAVTPFDDASLEALLAHSRAANARAQITGILLTRNGRFVQYLEGPEPAVRALIERISQDPRHTNVRVLLDDQNARRQFSEWTMGYEPATATPGPAPDGFRDAFDDLDGIDSTTDAAVIRATRELSFWFRSRASR